MPLVANGTTAAPAPTAAPTPAPAPRPVALKPSGPLSVLSGGPSKVSQLAPIQAVAPQPLAHHGGLPSMIGAPVNRIFHALSEPAYAIGSLANLHPLDALRHIAAIAPDVWSVAVPQVGDLYNRIPGVKPHESVMLGDVLRQHGLLPGGTLGDVLGTGASILGDPLTYVGLPGAGSALEHGTEAALRAVETRAAEKVAQVVGAGHRAQAAGEALPAMHIPDLQRAFEGHYAAQAATRAARGPGARLSLGIQGTKYVKEVGTIPGSAAVARAAGKVGGTIMKNEGLRSAIETFQRDFLTGGLERKLPAYKAAVATRRTIGTYQQKLLRQVGIFHQGVIDSVVKMGKGQEVNPATGKAWTLDQAYEQMAHHIEQPAKYAVPQELEQHVATAKDLLARLREVEVGHGIDVKDVPNYLTHRLRTPAERERFLAQPGMKAGAGRTPFFVKDERFPTIEAMKNAGFDAETNVAKLLQARVRAHTAALQDVSMRRVAAERAGVRMPSPEDIPASRIADLQTEHELAQGRLKELQQPTDLATYRERVASRLAQRRGAQFAERVAGRPAPALAARERASRTLAAARAERARVVAALKEAPRADELGAANLTPMERAGFQRPPVPRPGETIRAPAADMRGIYPAGSSRLPPYRPGEVRGGKGRIGYQAIGAEPGMGGELRAQYAREVMAGGATPVRRERDTAPFADVVKPGAPSSAPRAVVRPVETKATLRAARTSVERARKQVLRADRSADPIALKQAQRELEAAQRAHTEARIAHARAQGTYTGTPSAVRAATRKADVAAGKLKTALAKQEKITAKRAELAKLPGRVATPEEWKDVHKGFDALGQKYENLMLPGAKGRVRVPEQEMNVIRKVQSDIGQTFKDPNSQIAAVNFLKKLTSHWKVLALVSPGYHLRNAYGDAIGAWWAGARNPISYLQAGRIVKNQGNPEKLRAMRITVGGKTMTGEEFLHEAEAMGIHGQGFIGSELAGGPSEYAAERNALAKRLGWARKALPRHLPGEGAAARLSGKIGQAREDATRLGTYLDLRKQGKSIVDAADLTHTFLFDYGHVSRFVAEARRFWMPFITYTSKAVPRTLKMAVTRPGYFTHHAELADLLGRTAGVAPGGPENLPVGQRSSFGIPDPGGFLHHLLGMPADQPILWNPERISPWGTLNTLDPTQVQRTLLSNLVNPFVGAAWQVPTGHRFFYAGSAPRRAVAPPIINALHSLGLPIPDFGPKMSQALGHDVPGFSSTADEIARLFPPYSFAAGINPEDPEGMRRSLASYLAGLPLQSYDRAALAARAQRYGG